MELLDLHLTYFLLRLDNSSSTIISIKDAGLVGGGSFPQPGVISLSQNGVLFLDELPEFKRSVLEVPRQPMEERARTGYQVTGWTGKTGGAE